MSDITTIQVTQNKKGYPLNFTVKDADGEVVNLTGMTLQFRVAEKVTFTKRFAGNCVIVSATEGTCYYTVVEGNFDTVNNYYGVVQFTKDDLDDCTHRIEIEVEKDIPT